MTELTRLLSQGSL